MDLIDAIQALSAKIRKQKDAIKTEEATKTAFVLPFIRALGYDIFDPTEVIPEFTADQGIKKGEKVDYAISLHGEVAMLFECKACDATLDEAQSTQLYRYFSVTKARLAVLTDGIVYRFYSDIDAPNKMDSKPFMEFNMLDVQEHLVKELKRLTKQSFNIEEIISVAGDLKYTREIKRLCSEQFQVPSEDFVTFFARQVYPGKLTQSVREQFNVITKHALAEFMNDTINDRLRSAMAQSNAPAPSTQQAAKAGDQVVESTLPPGRTPERREEELQGFYIVKAILCEGIEPSRIVYRDSQNHLNILLDDTNRKPICRLGLERAPKYVGFINEQKQEERVQIQDVNDIFKHADRLRATVSFYENRAGSRRGAESQTSQNGFPAAQ